MPKIPTDNSLSVPSPVAIQESNINTRFTPSNKNAAKAAEYGTLSSIFDEAGKEYGQRYEKTLRAEASMRIAKEGADAQRYSTMLQEKVKQIGNDEEALHAYRTGMQAYADERLKGLSDATEKADLYGTLNRTSLVGEHEIFNFGQDRRRQRGVATMEDGLMSLDDAVLKAPSALAMENIYANADRLIGSAEGSNYINPEQAASARREFRNRSSAARITNMINQGKLGQAAYEIKSSDSYLSAQQVTQFSEAARDKGRALESQAKANIAQGSKVAQLEFQLQVAKGDAFDPEPYYQRMNNTDKLESQIFYQKADTERKKLQNEVDTFRNQLYSGAGAVSGDKEKAMANAVYLQDVESNVAMNDDERQMARMNFIKQTSWVPPVISEKLEGAFNQQAFPADGGNAQISPENKVQAAGFARQVRYASPAAYERLPTRVRAQSEQIMANMDMGMSPQVAVRKAEQSAITFETDKEAAATIKQELEYKRTYQQISDQFNGYFSSMPGVERTVSGSTAGRMVQEYRSIYETARLSGSEPSVAKDVAEKTLQTRFGVTEVGGERRIAFLPPENFYVLRPTPEENQKALKADFEAFVSNVLEKKSGLMNPTGILEKGNIDIYNRPRVKNADGSISTVRSMSFEEGGKEILIPTVSDDGKILSEKQAIDNYHTTGKFLGKFKTPDDATKYAKALHQQQEDMVSGAKYSIVADPQSDYELSVKKNLPSYQVLRMVEDPDGRTSMQVGSVRWRPGKWQTK